MNSPELWVAIVRHQDVPGDHLVLMYQSAEPTDRQVIARMRAEGLDPDDAKRVTVTHCYAFTPWLEKYTNGARLMAYLKFRYPHAQLP